ncbi:Respiratory nitrate reductase subunit alpha [Frankliniella fusca]|uniref:Respiratory nitrate reductase subunit alpha n=1 Tax=Frankliniella fusca TaxID=407009 RepID=A0AAE1HNY4_9NEOP|nr:Respiratory nitrate reductase subunit alpha [Frankliniella fusca]
MKLIYCRKTTTQTETVFSSEHVSDLYCSRRPFGLVHVDYQTGSLNRTLKDSSKFFIELNETGRVPFIPEPKEAGDTSAGTTSFVWREVLFLVVMGTVGLWLFAA